MRHSIYDDDRPENIRSTIFWTAAFLAVGYLIFNAFFPNNDVNIGVDILVGVMSTMALAFYVGAALKALWTGSRANTDYLIVGIALSWLSQDGQAWLRVVARLSGFSPAFLNSELFAPVKLLSVIAAVLHVIPKGAANGVVPRESRYAVLAAFGIAATVAVAVLVIRPDPRPMIERMPGWTRDLWHTGDLPARRVGPG